MGRKVVQVALVPPATEEMGGPVETIVALCDDGTLWVGVVNVLDANWLPLPQIPQDEVTP